VGILFAFGAAGNSRMYGIRYQPHTHWLYYVTTKPRWQKACFLAMGESHGSY